MALIQPTIEDFAQLLAQAGPSLEDQLVREMCEGSLYDFLKEAWPSFDPAPFVGGWHLEAICVTGDTLICTEDGLVEISQIARENYTGRVLSYNHAARAVEWRRVAHVMESPGRPVLRLRTKSGAILKCTEDHPVFDNNRGYIGARHLEEGSSVKVLRHLRDWFYVLPRRQPILQKSVLSGDACTSAPSGYENLSNLRQTFLPRYALKGKSRLLWLCLYGRRTAKARKSYLSCLWGDQVPERAPLSKMLRKDSAKRHGDPVHALWEASVQIARRICVRAATTGRVLQHALFWGIHSWAEQFSVCGWRGSRSLPIQLPHCTEDGCYSRPGSVFSVQSCRSNRRTPHQQEQVGQSFEQLGVPLPKMSQWAERYSRGSNHESDDLIVSIEREIRIPSSVFNLEVEGNNNYFAEGILVHNCEHLEAVSRGHIRKLLINIRPRSGKTGAVAVAWPTWTWALPADQRYPLQGPGVRFLCGSYGANKAQEDGVTARRLIASAWYQKLWGDRCVISRDRDNQERYDTTAGGSRINTGIPESLGKGGVIRFLDDPHKTDEVESDKVRESVLRAYKEIWSTRSNDPNKGAEVMIMQRQAENDLSGYWLETGGPETVHLCIPAWHEDDRRCQTYVNGHLFWEDPRTEEGESFWPERYAPSQRAVDEALGPFAFASQVQQRPEPRGGGIIRREWWQPWPPDDAVEHWTNQLGQIAYPPWEIVIAYLDTAFTKKETNDWCAMARLGVFGDSAGRPRAMLCGAWRERLNFRELIQKAKDTCRVGRVDILVIENKAGGNWVREELMKELADGEFTVVLDTPTVDKIARAHAVVPLFVDKMVHAPFMHEHGVWRAWSEMAISEIEKFPMGRHDDIVDAVVGGLGYLRRNDLIKLAVEHDADEREKKIFRGNQGGIAELYGVT